MLAAEFRSQAIKAKQSIPALGIAMDDAKSAYKQCPARTPPVIATWSERDGSVRYHFSWAMPFGYTSSVTSWCRIPTLLTTVCKRLFAYVTEAYIDDFVQVDPTAAGSSGHLRPRSSSYTPSPRNASASGSPSLKKCWAPSFHWSIFETRPKS